MTEPDWPELARLELARWTPRSALRAARTDVTRLAVPAIDVHNHLGRWLTADGGWMTPDVPALVAMLDEVGVETVVNLDGMAGDVLEENLDRYDRAHPGRFLTFCQLDWSLLAEPDGAARLCASLDDSARRGARGVKVWKTLGLHYADHDGRLIRVDDSRVVEVIRHAGELGLPVLIHTADPIAFFEPADERNERIEELGAHPDWWFGGGHGPGFDELLDAHARLVLACPGTRVIGAHTGGAAEDLDRVERLLDAAPNYAVDIAGRMAELGRQPRRTAALIRRHPDRVLFGTDAFPVTADAYRVHARFLETADESFEYAPGEPVPPQGRWAVSGLALEPELLEPLYRGNALRVLGGLGPR